MFGTANSIDELAKIYTTLNFFFQCVVIVIAHFLFILVFFKYALIANILTSQFLCCVGNMSHICPIQPYRLKIHCLYE
jgi:hypothetical protein